MTPVNITWKTNPTGVEFLVMQFPMLQCWYNLLLPMPPPRFNLVRLTMQTKLLQCQSLCWALLLLVGVNFLFGVVFMQLSMDFLEALDACVNCFIRVTSVSETFQKQKQKVVRQCLLHLFPCVSFKF